MTEAFNRAVQLLARREHGASELCQKLIQKRFSHSEALEAVAECQRLGLQNDSRFAAQYVSSRRARGYGSLKIIQELKIKGIDTDLIHQVLEHDKDIWLLAAQTVWRKKTKGKKDFSFNELQKYKRFLMQRGFCMEIIAEVIDTLN